MGFLTTLAQNTLGGTVNSVLGGFIGNYFGEKVAKKNHQRYLDVMNKQNDYNTPEKQIERIKKAGLSPGLMYGGNPGMGGTSTNPSTVQQPLSIIDVMSAQSNAQVNEAQAELMRSQAELNKTEIEKKTAETENIKDLNEGINLDNEGKKISNRLMAISEDFNALQLEIKSQTAEIEIAKAGTELKGLNTELEILLNNKQISDETRKAVIENATLINQEIVSNIALQGTEKSLKEAQKKLTNEQIENVKVGTQKLFEEIVKIRSDKWLSWDQYEINKGELEAKLKQIAIQENWYNDSIKQGYWELSVTNAVNLARTIISGMMGEK